MISNDILTGTAMLNAIWSQQHKDLLDLLLPFVQYSIGKKYKKGQHVKLAEIASSLDKELGYQSIPNEVIQTALKRLSPSVLKREHGEYWLQVDLSKEIERFENERKVIKERQEKVGTALASYLNGKLLGKKISIDESLDLLLDYFQKNGLLISRTTDEIDSIKKSSAAKMEYLVGQFVLEESKKDSVVFAYLLDMVRGSFVASAIYLQPKNYTMESSSFKNTTCYLDTRLILNLLGLNSKEEHLSAIQLLEMLIDMGARIACFNHTVEEVTSIIQAYRHSLQNPYLSPLPYGPTLPAWDEEGVTPGEIDTFLAGLHVKLRVAGVRIDDDPSYPAPQNYPIDELGLSNRLATDIKYGNEIALQRDVKSVVYVAIIRAGRKTSSIENCKAVFITTNSRLVYVVEDFLGYHQLESVSPVVLASKLASILWIKCFAKHGDYPKVKLLEDAMVSTAPSQDVLDEFFRLVDKMKAENTLTADEAAAMRSGLFQKRELMAYVDGDATKINEESVEMVKSRLRETYSLQDKTEIEGAKKQASKAREELLAKKQQALFRIDEAGEKARKRVKRALTLVTIVIGLAILAISVALAVHAYLLQNLSYGLSAVILLLLDILSVYDTLRGRWKLVSKLINRCAETAKNKAKDRERNKFDFLFVQ